MPMALGAGLVTILFNVAASGVQRANESTVNLYMSVLFAAQLWSPSTALPHSDSPWDIKLKDFINTEPS